MLTRDELISIAKQFGNKPWQQEKHYVQSAVIYSIADLPLVFKGGTYLWFFHGLPRFSEDLDFTSTGKISLKTIAEKVRRGLGMFGMHSEISQSKTKEKKNSMILRIDAKGPLYANHLSKTFVYIEISRREKLLLKPINLILRMDYYMIPQKAVLGMNLSEVAAEKVRAILTRDKARDVYDLHFLVKYKGIKFDPDLVNAKLSYYGLKYDKKKFISKLNKIEEYYADELSVLTNNPIPDFSKVKGLLAEWVG